MFREGTGRGGVERVSNAPNVLADDSDSFAAQRLNTPSDTVFSGEMKMNIYGIHGTQGVAAPHQAGLLKRNNGAETKSNVAARDEMEISTQQTGETQNVRNAGLDASEIRLDLVNRVRSEIAAGTYYSDEKFEIALDRMLRDIG